MIGANGDFPGSHHLAYRVVDLDPDSVTDSDTFVGVSEPLDLSAAGNELRPTRGGGAKRGGRRFKGSGAKDKDVMGPQK